MKILTVFGTRPEAIKMAPVVRALAADPSFDSRVCVTAQHRRMLDQVLRLFAIQPDHDLDLMRPGQDLTDITANVLIGLRDVLRTERPDLVLVHGDTTTTSAASLAAFYQRIPVGHVEAGLRTGNIHAPWPEEMNRRLTGQIAEWHFAPTERAQANLLREGVEPRRITVTGNTVIDALLQVAGKPYEFEDETLKAMDFDKRRVVTVTCHRRENLGENMEHIFGAIRRIAEEFADVEVVYPVHMNPKVRETAGKVLAGMDRVHLIEPLQYQPFVNLMARSYLIITDSGGMQEEAPSLGKPVLVVRRETERPEAVEAGTVKLAGVEEETIYGMAKELLSNQESYNKMAFAVNPYGDGRAAERIVDLLSQRKS